MMSVTFLFKYIDKNLVSHIIKDQKITKDIPLEIIVKAGHRDDTINIIKPFCESYRINTSIHCNIDGILDIPENTKEYWEKISKLNEFPFEMFNRIYLTTIENTNFICIYKRDIK